MKRLFFALIFVVFSFQSAYSSDVMTVSVSNTSISALPGWVVAFTKTLNSYMIYSPVEKGISSGKIIT